MPNKYSHSGVLAQYCQSGFISLPENLYLAYLRASSVGSLEIPSQQSTGSRESSSEDETDDHGQLTRPRNLGLSSTVNPVHDERGRGKKAAELPQFPFSHKPNPQDRAALITSFMKEIDHEIEYETDRDIDNEFQSNVIHQPHPRKGVDSRQRTESPQRHGISIQESSGADPASYPSRPRRDDRSAWKSTYPPVSRLGNSSVSLALSAASSGEYALDIPGDFPSQVDGATATSRQTRIRLQNDEPVDASVAEQNSIANPYFVEQRPVDGQEFRHTSASFLPRSGSVRGSKETNDSPKAPPRSASRRPSGQESDDNNNDANPPKTVPKVMLHSASACAAVPSQKVAEHPRNSSRSWGRKRSQQKNREDNSLTSISDSVSETGIEVVDKAALSSYYDNGVKSPEHEATAVARLPSLQRAMPAELVVPREVSLAPAIGSNEIRNIQHWRGDQNRPVSATSADTQIYAPLSSTSLDSPYTDSPAFIPRSNVVGPGPLSESAAESAPEPSLRRTSQSRRRTNGLHVQAGSPSTGLYDSSASGSDSGSVGIPTVQPSRTLRSTSRNRTSKYTPVYRDRKQEWLDDPSHNVGHYRTYLLKRDSAGHKRFASGYSSRTESRESGSEGSVTKHLNSLTNMTVEPMFPEELDPEDVGGRPVSVLSETSASTSEASSGFYPPDIPRYREEAPGGPETTPRGSGYWSKREESTVVLGLGDGGEGEAVGRNLSSSDGKSWERKNYEKEKERDWGGAGVVEEAKGR